MGADVYPRLIYFVLLLAVVGGYLAVEFRRRPGRVAQQAVVWGLIFVGVIAGAGLWSDIRHNVTPQQSVASDGQIEVPIAADGHFYLVADLNGVAVRFVVDTGATDIVLSQRDARRIGIDTAGLSYFGQANTANGLVATAPVRIERFALGGVTDENLRAVVNNGAMEGSLLGMSYLSRFANVSFSRNRLLLER